MSFSFVEVEVDREDSKKRIDQLISEKTSLSRSRAKTLIEEGRVKVNGEVVKKSSYKVKKGDKITVEIPEPEPLELVAEDIPLDVVYEDKDVIVINKPPGLVVHPAPGHARGTLVNALLYHCKDLQGINGTLRPGIVHRLDKDTAGLIVAAKNEKAQQSLVEQFKNRTIGRFYRALVWGIPKEKKKRIVLPIGRDRFDRKKFSPNTTSPKEAITNYEVVEEFVPYNVAEVVCKLETGRTHQIRVHMSYLGYPLLGDKTYGFKISKVEDEGLKRLLESSKMHMLCAYYLSFKHPSTGKVLVFKVEPPEDYLRVLNYLKSG